MTDRELLELAAKAAGIAGQYIVVDGKECIKYVEGEPGSYVKRYWMPRHDDGDALRLAVKLTLEIDICHSGIAVRTPDGHKVLVNSDEKPNGYAATRLAIVRAAAEIGKTL